MYVIISPAIKLVGKEIKIDYSTYEKYFGETETGNSINIATVEETYKVQLEKQIKADIESMGYSVNKVSTEFDLDNGIIKSVNVSVDKANISKSDINIVINKVEVGNLKETNNLSLDEIQTIKQKLNQDYGVDYQNITVNSI